MSKPANVFEGKLDAKGLKIAIACSRFNTFFVEKLLDGAYDAIVRHGGSLDNVDVAWCPGSYELPYVASRFLANGKYDAVIALGCVIQGATAHASYINGQVSKSLGQLSLESGIPVIYGVLTTENIEQAIERSGTKAGTRGFDVTVSAIEMANLAKSMNQKGKK